MLKHQGKNRLNIRLRSKWRDKLFELQNGICAICGGLMDKDPNSPDYVSFDRILTGSEGYGYFYLNLRGVHKKCNEARGCNREDIKFGSLIITMQIVTAYQNLAFADDPHTILSWIMNQLVNSSHRHGLGWDIYDSVVQDARFHEKYPGKVGGIVKFYIRYRYRTDDKYNMINDILDGIESHINNYWNVKSKVEAAKLCEYIIDADYILTEMEKNINA